MAEGQGKCEMHGAQWFGVALEFPESFLEAVGDDSVFFADDMRFICVLSRCLYCSSAIVRMYSKKTANRTRVLRGSLLGLVKSIQFGFDFLN